MNIEASVKKRIDFIDVAKGISIILVAVNHSKLYEFFPTLNELIGLIRMPLFFFVSGFFLSTNATYSSFLLKKLRGILQPYFVTLLSVCFMGYLYNSRIQVDSILGVLYGVGDTISWTATWFLPHLFLLSFCSFCLLKVCQSRIVLTVIIFSTIIIGYLSLPLIFDATNSIKYSWWPHSISGLPFSIDLLPFSMLFFMLGTFAKSFINDFDLGDFRVAVFALIVLLFVFINFNPDINLNQRVLHEPVSVFICAISGIYLILFTSFRASNIKLFNSLFQYFGKTSLYILIFHGPIMFWTYYYSERILFHLGGSVSAPLLLTMALLSFLAGVSIPPLIKKIYFVRRVLSPYS